MTSRALRSRRIQMITVLTAALAVLASPAVSAVPTSPAPPADSTSALPADLRLLDVKTSLLGEHRWYEQVISGYPVVGGLYAEHEVTSGAETGAVTIWDGRVPAGALVSPDATIDSAAAIEAAVAHTGGRVLTFVGPELWVVPAATSRLAWKVITVTDGTAAASHATYVDAQTGAVLRSEIESKNDTEPDGRWVTGKARTFDPNPVIKLQDQDLTDQNDSNNAVPDRGYSIRKLRNLDRSHTLVGRWARVVNDDLASSPNNEYLYKRASEYFEQTMAYYGLDTQQMYYRELGFTDVNAEPQRIETNTISDDNSFYSPSQDLIVMGAGGVDDAEDPEVTWHEAGHATQDDQVPNFGIGNEAGAIGEAYGDYIAVTLSQQFGRNTETTPTACVMDWDATSYDEGPIHCLRRTDTDKHYPEDLVGQVHADGEIWSRALWDMNRKLGRDRATTAIVEAQFNFAPNTDMPDAAEHTVKAAKDLYGKKFAKKAEKIFKNRGIL